MIVILSAAKDLKVYSSTASAVATKPVPESFA